MPLLSGLIPILLSVTSSTSYTVTVLNAPDYAATVATCGNGNQIFGFSGTPSGASGPFPIYDVGSALQWSTTNSDPVIWNPEGFLQGSILSGDDGDQVGVCGTNTNPNVVRAFLWKGSKGGTKDLNPTNARLSVALGIGATGQVGMYLPQLASVVHAIWWKGTASSGIDLQPSNKFPWGTAAYGLNAVHQVGIGYVLPGQSHATLWSGTANSVVDLNPAGFSTSWGFGISATNEIGSGVPSNSKVSHALLWKGTASSAVDLNPPKFTLSSASSTNGPLQVGYASVKASPLIYHAILWKGTAASFIDLHTFVPATINGTAKTTGSAAYSIDSTGRIYGSVFVGTSAHAAIWTPVSKP